MRMDCMAEPAVFCAVRCFAPCIMRVLSVNTPRVAHSLYSCCVVSLQDLKKKPKLREKYGIADEWVMPFEVLPIIDIPGFGDCAAQVCDCVAASNGKLAAALAVGHRLACLLVCDCITSQASNRISGLTSARLLTGV
jgi:hypothetical protein